MYEMLDEVERLEQDFYQPVIEVHENQRLRSFAAEHGSIEVYKQHPYSQDVLMYSQEGFLYHTSSVRGDYGETGYSVTTRNNYQVKGGKLVARNEVGRELEMLLQFPNVTIGMIESGLELAIINVKNKYRGGK